MATAERESRRVRGIRPRQLTTAIALIVVVAIIGAIILVLNRPKGPIEDVSFARDSTATVLYAGTFPAAGDPALLNPLGIDLRDGILYVAESDAGRISLFALDGSPLGSIAVPRAVGALAAYPADVAALGKDRLVIVDNAGARVLVMLATPKAQNPVVAILGADDPKTRPIQPTAATVREGEILVADGGDHSIKVYNPSGAYIRTMAEDLKPVLAFIGGMVVRGNELVVTDSNAGRVLVLDVRTGKQLRAFPGLRALPRGLGVGPTGGTFVTDTFERAVYLMSPAGVLLDTISGEVAPKGALGSPRDVVWDAGTSRVYVTDAGSGRVLVYQIRILPKAK